MLHTRYKQLLKLTIETYIQTAEPVSSQWLADHVVPSVSAATIRSQLKQLEADGYLVQLHTSSGRIPSDKGYRFYIDHLMNQQTLSSQHTSQLSGQLLSINNPQTQAVQVAATMASFLNYITIVLEPVIQTQSIVAFHVVALDSHRLNCVLFNQKGVCWQTVLVLDSHGYSADQLSQLSSVLSAELHQKSLNDVNALFVSGLAKKWPLFKPVLLLLLAHIQTHISQNNQNRQLALKGLPNLLGLPEFKQSDVAQNVFSALESNKLFIADLAQTSDATTNCTAIIGAENAHQSLHACSLVVTPFSKGDTHQTGLIGVVGPTRMSYSFIMPFLQHVSKIIQND